jgi:hypothetical protein
MGQLKKLPLNHLRVEVKMHETGFRAEIEKASRESGLLGWPLFVVLYLSENSLDEIQKFISLCMELNLKVRYLLPVGRNHLPNKDFTILSEQVRNKLPGTLVGTGVNAYFAELNRIRPVVEKADFVSFTICPQVHAFDNSSLVENLEAQAEVIASAKKIFPDKPIFVSPVSLKQRFNVVATSEEPILVSGVLPPSVDVRQLSVFAASWTLGSLKFLSQANAALISYFETVGWKGFIQGEKPSEIRKLFPSEINQLFPVYGALKEVSGYSHIVHSFSSHPLQFDGLVIRSEQEIKLFLFNFSVEEISVRVNLEINQSNVKSLHYNVIPEIVGGKVKLRGWDLVVFRFPMMSI